MILIVGCQHNWSIQEKQDFMKKCIKHRPSTHDLDNYKVFCDCIMKNFISLDLSYMNFLKMDSNNSDTEKVLQSCIKAP